MAQQHSARHKDLTGVRFSKPHKPPKSFRTGATFAMSEPGIDEGLLTPDTPSSETNSTEGGSGKGTTAASQGHDAARPFGRSKSSFRLVNVLEVGRKLQRKASFGRRQRVKKGVRWGVIGVRNSLAEDFQFHCLDMEWGPLLALVFSAYFACSCLFAAAFYYISVICEERHHLMGEIPTHMSLAEACFWFSVNNLLTIGYGAVVPGSRTACIITTLEHFTGIMMSSLLLGIVVTKASLPSSKIIFSSRCLITKRNGIPHLLVRVGNTRGNFLTMPEIRLSYLVRLVTREGEVTFKGQRMEFTDPPHLAPCLNVTHTIDTNSPLYGKSAADIDKDDGAIFVSMSATDELSGQTVYAKQVYRSEDVLFDHRYQDVLISKNGLEHVDFRRFHEVVPITEISGQEVLDLTTRLGHRTFAAFKAESNLSSMNLKLPKRSDSAQESKAHSVALASPKPSNPTTPLGTPPLLSRTPSNSTFTRDAQTLPSDPSGPPSPRSVTANPTNQDEPSGSDLREGRPSGAMPSGEPLVGSAGEDKGVSPMKVMADGGKPSHTEQDSDSETEGVVKVGRTGEYRCY